ncbi:reverse transcriptase [Lasius niger]|uniref:Reverse transcriptase n=1 Tax=Lasius niger TaxID=67767 RepID=A0A0J7KIV1_LASNI|nr:reverse transcriptase [Lasius niger]
MLQLNMRRSAVVTGEVRQLIVEKRLDVLLLQEPHVKKQGLSHTFVGLGIGMRVAAVRSQRPWAAVAVCNPKFQIMFVSQLSTTHCVCAEVQAPGFSFYVASCYFQYSDKIEEHLRHLEAVFHSLRGKRLIVAVDANARSSLWGSQETDDRGAKLEDLVRAYGIEVVNDVGQAPTFWTARGSSFIDVTLASPSISQFIGDWKVRCDWTTSDHNSVDIRLRVPRGRGGGGTANTRFDIRRADWERFSESLADLSRSRLEVLGLQSAEDVEEMANTLTIILNEACTASMPKKRHFRKSNPWWTRELTIIKKKVYRLKRALQKGRDEPSYQEKLLEYRSSLRKYNREVRKAKLVSWRNYVTSYGNSEPWGFVYKQQAEKLRVERVLSTLRRGKISTMSLEETASYLLEVHVPNDQISEDTPQQSALRENALTAPDTADAPLFLEAEVARVVKSFKNNNKAPGPDLVEVKVLKTAVKVIPGQITRLFNGCLQWGVFPKAWKTGSLRALLKGEDKDEQDPKSYRPICLLSVIGKLFEKLIKLRLMDTSLAPGGVSDRQFGFMPGRSTEDAVVELRRMVSASEKRHAVALLFDISGAFDNVWWPLGQPLVWLFRGFQTGSKRMPTGICSRPNMLELNVR